MIYYPKQFIIFQASPCLDCSNSPLQGLMCPLWVDSYWLCYQIDYLKQLILSGQIVILHPPLHFQTIVNFLFLSWIICLSYKEEKLVINKFIVQYTKKSLFYFYLSSSTWILSAGHFILSTDNLSKFNCVFDILLFSLDWNTFLSFSSSLWWHPNIWLLPC